MSQLVRSAGEDRDRTLLSSCYGNTEEPNHHMSHNWIYLASDEFDRSPAHLALVLPIKGQRPESETRTGGRPGPSLQGKL